MKNHVNGIAFADGKIMVTPHGFLRAKETAEEKISREQYVKDNLDYISKLFGEKVSDLKDIKFDDVLDANDSDEE